MTKRKHKTLKTGKQVDDIVHVITTYCDVGSTFTAAKVWATMGQRRQTNWIDAYGGRDNAFRRVKVALNNINYSGRIGIERTGPGEFKYLSPDRVKPMEAYQRSVDKGKKKAKRAKDPVDKPVSKPVTPQHTKVTEHKGFRHVGFDLDGRPIYIDHETQRAGYVRVVTSFTAL